MTRELGWTDKRRYIEKYRTDNIITSHFTDVKIKLK